MEFLLRDINRSKQGLIEELKALQRHIAELEKSGSEHHQAQQLVNALFSSSPIGLYIVQDRCFRVASTEFQQISGYSEDELIGTPSLSIVFPDDRDMVRDNAVKVLKGERTPGYEFRIVAKSGETKWIMESIISVPYYGRPATLGNFMDITERKRAEEELQKAAKQESLGILAGGVAHDFNNILTAILGNVTLAKRDAKPGGKILERLLEAEKACLRARDLTQQLMTFSKGREPVKKVASITEVIKDSASLVLRGSNVRCEFSIPDVLWLVEFDEGQISQVISNLVINADEAMPGGGVIKIGAKNTVVGTESNLPLRKGRYVEITVEDHGVGIPKEHLNKILDPYFTTKRRGSGLGLATTYSIIKNHNGHITVRSEMGVGTNFSICLPASDKLIPVKKESVPDTRITGRGKILVMDDEEMIREMLGSILAFAGYQVELASDGAEAIERYIKAKERGEPFAAVILDLTVPGGMGGKEAIEKLLEVDPEVRTIVSSGYPNDPIVANFGEFGFKGVATKPYATKDLERTLRGILKSKKSG